MTMSDMADFSLAKSVIQKAVRRGNVEAIAKASGFILKQDSGKSWLNTRSKIIAFEESWPLIPDLVEGPFGIAAPSPLLTCALHSKQKDAAGLGTIARAWSEGDAQALEVAPDPRGVKIVAEAMNRPSAFWAWAEGQALSREARLIVLTARKTVKIAYSQGDAATIFAAAYLSTQAALPVLRKVEPEVDPFPYWVAADKHTLMGAGVIADVSRSMGWSWQSVATTLFYLDGAAVNQLEDSPWWSAARRLHFHNIGIREERAVEIVNNFRHKIVEIIGDRVERALDDKEGGGQAQLFQRQ